MHTRQTTQETLTLMSMMEVSITYLRNNETFFLSKIIFAVATVKYASLHAVFIFFDTATYDEIERDVKVDSVNNHKMTSDE